MRLLYVGTALIYPLVDALLRMSSEITSLVVLQRLANVLKNDFVQFIRALIIHNAARLVERWFSNWPGKNLI